FHVDQTPRTSFDWSPFRDLCEPAKYANPTGIEAGQPVYERRATTATARFTQFSSVASPFSLRELNQSSSGITDLYFPKRTDSLHRRKSGDNRPSNGTFLERVASYELQENDVDSVGQVSCGARPAGVTRKFSAKRSSGVAILFHCATKTEALEAHVSAEEGGGAVVVNASMGQGWSYRVDYNRSTSALPFLQLDSSTGHIFWKGDDLTFSSAVKMCFTSTAIPVDFTMSILCDSTQMFQVPFRLTMYPKSENVRRAHRRSKRAVNNRPTFNPTEYTENVKEEQPAGIQVVTITATDSDTEGAGTITYSMVSSRDERSQSMFAINPLTGTINTTKRLDREFMKAHYFSIIATDHGVPPESASATLTIIVEDVNDHAPAFDQQVYSIDFSESQEIGIPVLTIQATDEDFMDNSNIRYSIVNPESPNDAFMIDPIVGSISTLKQLDRETISNYTLLIQAVDQGELSERKSSTATVKILIRDENDNAPEFSRSVYTANIKEDQSISSSVPILTVTATDRDEGENANIRYTLSGNGHNTFSINSMTGQIFLMDPLDYETDTKYSLTVRAEDQGTTKRRQTATVHIQVIDVNDNAPRFISDRYEGVVSENSDSGTSIIQVQAIDLDSGQNSQLTYSIINAENDTMPLVIDPQSGWIRTSGRVDREHQPAYTFTVKAEDNGSPRLSATTTVSIKIRDINDNAPVFESRNYQAAVSEEARIGEEVIRVLAIDQDEGDNARVRYDITTGNDGDAFQMNQNLNEGIITVKKTLDARQQNRYVLTVTATDTGGRKDTVQVVINVTDTNRYTPEFQGTPFSFSVDENIPVGTSVYQVRAIDKDRGENARITYSMDPGVLSFRVDPNNGTIFTRGTLDRESMPAVRFSVTATDNGIPQRMDTKEIDVTIIDENDNKPEFVEIIYSGHISEDALPGEKVLQISARDYDKNLNGQVFYTFDGGNSGNGDFSIDSARGWIMVAKPLDRERIPNYELVAFAVDRGTPPQSSSVIIRIKVDDVNDNHPQFDAEEIDVFIAENSPVGSTVAEVTASDPDEGTNALVEYSFDGGPDVDSFQLSGRKGEPAIITTLIPLDYESDKKRYEVVLRAASGTQFSTAKIFINVRDVNDNPPVLKDFSIIFNNYGETGSFPSEAIGRIPATDPDVSDQELLVYRILSGNDANLLHLNSSTGYITLDSLLNSDVPRNGTFQVSVSGVARKSNGTTENRCKEDALKRNAAVTANSAGCEVTERETADRPVTVKWMNRLEPRFVGLGFTPVAHRCEDLVATDRLVAATSQRKVTINTLLAAVQGYECGVQTLRLRAVLVVVAYGKNVVKATCRLYVRLVTPEMLHDSVTIRLDRMTQTAFLSSLLKFFIDALATIFHTDDTNIFIINIEDDIDVAPAQILNVSVAVRQGSESVQGLTKDVFYSPEYLREYIYLYRSLLANLSALQVLPFDDNLCLQEPCPRFEVCLSMVRRGEARPFISSDTVMFRPVHPDNGYKCVCPHGFAGRVQANNCDIEVDLCYSMPCQNGGTCVTHESGYTCLCTGSFEGKNCEVNMTTKYDAISCPQDFCRAPSVCVPLIRGGFRCDGCPDDGNYDQFCRLKTRSFRKGSYLTFPSLKMRNRFTIRMKFATQEKNGLLLYNGRFNEKHDFVGLEVANSQVSFMFSLGNNHTRWIHTCQEGLALANGWRSPSSITTGCENPTENCYRLLDLTGPLQVGGLPWAPSTGQVTQKDFVGCISEVYIDEELLDLNTSVVNFMTTPGCSQKRLQCQNSPCTLGGKCQEGWTTFTCECPEKAGGKDCSQGNGYLSFDNLAQSTVHHSNIWHNGIAFRTRAESGTLMQIMLNTGQIQDGYIIYSYESETLHLDSRKVNDGQWHYVVAKWNQGRVDLELDYGQYVISTAMRVSVSGSEIQIVYVGGYRNGNGPITDGFVGCVKDIRVGINAVLSNPRETNVDIGCSAPDSCSAGACGPGTCVDLWGDYECVCPPGTMGPECENICSEYNPCQNWAECQNPTRGESTYTCDCGNRQSGRYCENMAPTECPAAWWGNPVCGPCNCDPAKGFESKCDKKNGTCFCKELHYQPEGADRCYPCDCYSEGSESSVCDNRTGQCHCRDGVVGRRCDQCDSVFAGIDLATGTCKVMSYEKCPRNFAKGIWWVPVPFEETAFQDCPHGASGNASRRCTEKSSWLEADLSNCTSESFTKLQLHLTAFQEGRIDPFYADGTIELLKNATNTTSPLYGGDIVMTLEFAKVLLEYEINQNRSLSLISQQHRDFIPQLVIALSNVTSLENAAFWPQINKEHQGAATLIRILEEYLIKIAKIMPLAKSSPFEAFSDGIVLGADWMTMYNVSGRPVPKYDNNVNKASANDYARIRLPASIFPGSQSAKSYFGYAIYHTMGKLVEMNTDDSVRKTGRPLTVNGPMFTFVVTSQGGQVSGSLPDNAYVYVQLKLASPENRTNLQCATYAVDANGYGVWSAAGCSIADEDCQVTSDSDECQEVYITCRCSHLSTFAVIVDLEDGTALRAAIVSVSVMVYVLVGVSLALLLFCRLMAIFLHYFYMAAFAWLYVEVLHIYRMLTEKHTINYGSMKFYYLLGYVIPGIIVGLAVGLYTDGYGNDSFCWLETSELFIWSFAGPIVVVVLINIITFMLAVKASCREKVHVADISSVRLGLMGAILLLLLLSVTWVLGLLTVNFDLPALGYVHAVFLLLQGVCLFFVYILISRK
ncbi:hypothetical protein BaRGS_00028839, partial [Batillaria attramentaria]